MEIFVHDDLFESEDELHNYLIHQLKFPDYYGKNLDALYDALCDLKLDLYIGFEKNTKFKDVFRCFTDAKKINKRIKVKEF